MLERVKKLPQSQVAGAERVTARMSVAAGSNGVAAERVSKAARPSADAAERMAPGSTTGVRGASPRLIPSPPGFSCSSVRG